MRRTAALAAALALPLAAARADAPCRVERALEPARAFVGQQVVHRETVVRPEDLAPTWSAPLRFPGFRVEALGSGAPAERIVEAGRALVQVESRTALFPVRAGAWRLPEARLLCGEHELVVPGASFEALPWPEAGRPAGFTGVVGALELTATVDEAVPLGGTVRLHVSTRGAANLWDAELHLALDPPDTEVFRRPPRISRRGEAPVLVVRHDVFDLVPRHGGELHIAPVRIPYLDPERGDYRIAATPGRVVRVLPAAAAPAASGHTPPAGASPTPGRPGSSGGSGRPFPVWPLLGSAAALLAAGAWAAFLRARRRRDPVAALLREAERAASRDARAAALERALRAWLAGRGLDPLRSATDPLLVDSPDETVRACAHALARLERARFAGRGCDADLDAIQALLGSRAAPRV